jgi:hypothetical protein
MTQPFSENQVLLFLQQNVISDETIHLKRDFSVIERNVEARSSIDFRVYNSNSFDFFKQNYNHNYLQKYVQPIQVTD